MTVTPTRLQGLDHVNDEEKTVKLDAETLEFINTNTLTADPSSTFLRRYTLLMC